ncbi:amidohydrolase family protein [Shinella curvata]|uniref:Amidohydrolase family protein n=1 Tax=Shinella curvata TaxID=1817964 RepID=A0ABT8XM88_9HYPH|nr:amidohydrolase family protein [Shinella curvata]MCJ8056722.1 amidohydrolase family protein [Shinella curvata]MDO6124839.1 amidohydrolase family protein [Shinella curvata]
MSNAPDKADRLLIRNLGAVLTGELAAPLADADTILIENGKIAAVGREADIGAAGIKRVIDAKGSSIMPGMIDNHSHPVMGDWTPRQNQLGWIDSTLHGGVTTLVSAGEVHLPGRPRDVIGVKALAITAQRAFANFSPTGMKVLAGALILEHGLEEKDFSELADAGVTLVGEVGLGTVKDGPTGRKMIDWARQYGMTSMTHTGGHSIPGSSRIGADVVLEVDADVAAHMNGGPTSLPFSELELICRESKRGLEIIHNGNMKAGLFVLDVIKDVGALDRLVLGTDGPAGSGVQPLGMLRLVTMLASLGGVSPEVAVCFATGNVAKLRGLNDRGRIAPGLAADLVFIDQAMGGGGDGVLDSMALGNLPGIGMILVDGVQRTARSRNTPPSILVPETHAA